MANVICGDCGKTKTVETIVEGVSPTVTVKDGDCGCTKTHSFQVQTRDCNQAVNIANSQRYYPTEEHRYSSGHKGGFYPDHDPCTSKCSTNLPRPVPPRPAPCIVNASRDTYAIVDNRPTIPEIGFSSEFTIKNVNLAKGQALCNPTYGRLSVKEVIDLELGLYDLENLGDDSTTDKYVGRSIPANTTWLLCSSITTAATTSTCIELLEDFRAPAVGLSYPARVSSLLNMTAGKKVIIRNRINPADAASFEIVSTSSTDTVLLKNTGAGGDGSKTFAAKDCNTSANYCVEVVGIDKLCDAASVTTCIKTLFGFDKDCNQVKITGDTQDQVLAFNAACGGFKLAVLPETVFCVKLTKCFQVAPTPTVTTGSGCKAQEIYIDTDNNASLLAQAQLLLTSNYSDVVITICGDKFILDVSASTATSIKITPLFTTTVTKFYDDKCSVCLPNCCNQCNPQVTFISDAFAPPGKTDGYNIAIPAAAFAVAQSPAAYTNEYLFQLIQQPAGTLLVLKYDPVTLLPVAAYNNAGADVLATLTDVEDLLLTDALYCNNTACSKKVTFKVAYQLSILSLPANSYALFANNLKFYTAACDVITTGIGIRTHASQMVNFVGPTITANVLSNQGFGEILPSGNILDLGARSLFEERSVILSRGDCFRGTIRPSLIIKFATTQANLTAAFTAPAIGSTNPMTVTSVAGWVVGQYITVSSGGISYSYEIISIAGNTAVLKNNGQGGVGGVTFPIGSITNTNGTLPATGVILRGAVTSVIEAETI